MAADNAKTNSAGGLKVLVVEDDKFLQKMLLMKFGSEGYKVTGASDGEEALKQAFAETPDLVLLDLILPKVNGFEVLTELKAEPKTREVPVIVLSNLGQEEDMRRVKNLGAVDFLVKSNMSIHDVVGRVKDIYKEHAAGKTA
jgi:DNA-binding response OmpR family regulator